MLQQTPVNFEVNYASLKHSCVDLKRGKFQDAFKTLAQFLFFLHTRVTVFNRCTLLQSIEVVDRHFLSDTSMDMAFLNLETCSFSQIVLNCCFSHYTLGSLQLAARWRINDEYLQKLIGHVVPQVICSEYLGSSICWPRYVWQCVAYCGMNVAHRKVLGTPICTLQCAQLCSVMAEVKQLFFFGK